MFNIIVVPITSGLITGAINATITAGLAYPALYNNSTVEVPAIILYGTTTDDDDKLPYLIQLAGVGKVTEQVTRVVSHSVQNDPHLSQSRKRKKISNQMRQPSAKRKADA